MMRRCRPAHAGRRSIVRTVTARALLAAGLLVSSFDVAAADVDHLVTFVNLCRQQVWLARYGGNTNPPQNWALAPLCNEATKHRCPSGSCLEGSCTCTTDADCTFGSTAETTASCEAGTCVRSTTVTVPAGPNQRFWARTGCSGTDTEFVCETGQCGPPSGGNIDCDVQAATGNQATLFEITPGGADARDNFDVSLVSGFNVPIEVKVQLPADAPVWKANTFFSTGGPGVPGAMIIETVGTNTFNFTAAGASGTSGTKKPQFPAVWGDKVSDGPDLMWVNTGPVCQNSGCLTRKGIQRDQCPSKLRIESGGGYVGCDVPANVCAQSGAACAKHLDYYQCQNNGGAKDLFGKVLSLQSPNAGTFVCFSESDCPSGTTCELNPTFESGYVMTKGAGVCTPVAQNGGCGTTDDGKPCSSVNYPFVDYTCQTLANTVANAQVCIPPSNGGLGDLWWNAANWQDPGSSCTGDGDCGSGEKCLSGPVNAGLKQCPTASGSCACWKPKQCTAATCPGANQCLNQNGVPDGKPDGGSVVDCSVETCYCGPQGIYSGTCGPTNPRWKKASREISDSGARWPHTFKAACPRAYSYQYDDPSSDWGCVNSPTTGNDYIVTFCGKVPE